MLTRTYYLVLCTAAVLACDLAPEDGGHVDEGTTSSPPPGNDDTMTSTTSGANGTNASGDDGETPSGETGELTDMGLCEAACVWETGCEPGYPMAQCVADCLDNLVVFDGDLECDKSWHTLTQCQGEFTSCDPTPLPEECAQAAATNSVCEDSYGCDLAAGGAIGGDGCEALEECGMKPSRSVVCDTETCTCTVDNVAVGECPAPGVCQQLNAGRNGSVDVALECCGFEGWGEPAVPGT